MQSHPQGGAPYWFPAPEPNHTLEGAGTGNAPRYQEASFPHGVPDSGPSCLRPQGRGAQLGPPRGGFTCSRPPAPRPQAAARSARSPAPPPPAPRSGLRAGTSGHPSSPAAFLPSPDSAGAPPRSAPTRLRLPGDFPISPLTPPTGAGCGGVARARTRGCLGAGEGAPEHVRSTKLGRKLGDHFLNMGNLRNLLPGVLPHHLG